jgi:putative Mg2+ transporter-C (MgtC) family protein
MISTTEIFLRLIIGAVFGGAIGFERQVHGRPAGFRTHMLVCVASVLIMIVSEYFYYLSYSDPSFIRIDPGRIAAGAITGVGFLGAGVIIKTGITVQGLTTAASLWMVSAIGLSIGSGLYLAGTGAFGLTLFALIILRALERKMTGLTYRSFTITAREDLKEEDIMSVLNKYSLEVYNIDYEKDIVKEELTYRITVAFKTLVPIRGILDELSALTGISKVVIKS